MRPGWPRIRRRCEMPAVLLAIFVGGCSQGALLPILPGAVELGEPNAPTMVQGSANDVYTRIARGALACWFGADGALKSSHIFHADGPPQQGGGAEISLIRIESDQPRPRGRQAFRVSLDRAPDAEDGATAIMVESFGLPDDLASRMRADVFQWIDGIPACSTRESPDIAALTGGAASAPDVSPSTSAPADPRSGP